MEGKKERREGRDESSRIKERALKKKGVTATTQEATIMTKKERQNVLQSASHTIAMEEFLLIQNLQQISMALSPCVCAKGGGETC